MKILFFLAIFGAALVFIREYKQSASGQLGISSEQRQYERAVINVAGYGPMTEVDYISLFPPGLDPLADNLLTQPFVLEDFTGELLFPTESPTEIPAPSNP
jgi:hypothetical protein